MNWGRAKSILISSFLLLNLLLGYQLWASRPDQSTLSAESVIIEETNKLLESKNIRIEGDVPKETPKLKQIGVSLDEKYRDDTKIVLPNPISFSNLQNKNVLKEVLTKVAVESSEVYQLDPVTSKDNIIILHQMAGELPMFDVTLQLFSENGVITGYKQAYVEVQSGGGQKEQRIISAYTAIRSLAENFVPEGSVIVDVRLGYHGRLYDSQIQYMLPSWRVVLAQGDTYYVQALSGEVQRTQGEEE